MAEFILTTPNWLGSSVGMVLKTATIDKTTYMSKAIDENGRKVVKSGTLINDENLGKGLLFQDADITDEDRVASIMIKGSYIDSQLPESISSEASELAKNGLYAIEYADTVIAYGKVPFAVTNFQGLKNRVANGGDIILDNDISITAKDRGDLIEVRKDTTIDLNGRKIYVDSTANEEDIFTVKGATLTLMGNGEVEGKDCYIVSVGSEQNSKAIIKGGTYKATDSATAVHSYGGKVIIEGGSFSNTAEMGTSYGTKYLINVQDNVPSKASVITITGGTFEGFNPAINTDGNFVPSTHESKKNDGNSWTVVLKP